MNSLIQRLDHSLSYGLGRWHSIVILLLALLLGLLLVQLPLSAAVMAFAAAALLLLSFIQPLVPLGAAIVAGPFGAYENITFGNLPIESGQLIFMLAVGSWLGHRLIKRPGRITRPPLMIPLLIFLLVSSFSLLGARSFDPGIKEAAKWVEIALVMIMVVDQAQWLKAKSTHKLETLGVWGSMVQERWFIIMLLLAGGLQALIGIWQFAIQENGPDHFSILDRFYRAYGTFMQPNPFGGMMSLTACIAIGTVIGVGLSLLRKRRNWQNFKAQEWLWFIFLVAMAVLAVLSLIMSWSRGAWMGFAAGMALLLFFLPKRRWLGLGLVVSAAILLIITLQLDLLPTSIASRLSGFNEYLQFEDVRGIDIEETNYAVVERLAHWQSALEMAKDNIWLGVGFGNYESAYPEYQLLNWPFPLGHAHNYYLNVLAETGIIGLLTFLAFWFVLFYQIVRVLRNTPWAQRGLALGLLAAWTALSIHHLVDKLYVNNLFLYMGVMMGLQQVLAIKYDNSVR